MKAFPFKVGFEDVVSNLGFDAQQAIDEVTRLSLALERLEAVMTRTAGAVKVFNAAGKGFSGVSTNVGSLSKAQQELINVSGQVPKLMKSNFVSMESLEKKAGQLSNQIQKSSKQMILSWQSVLRIFTIQVAHQAIARLTGLIRDSLAAAQDYEIQLAAIRTINEDFSGGLDATSAAISGLAGEFAKPVEDIAAGFYQILSDQIENSSDALLVLTESLKLSRAALSTTEEAAGTITGVLNAFGKQTFETAHISDVLFRTVDLGRVTLSELANSLGKVNVLSSRLGVTFEEQQAALATITIQGIDAAEGMTFLRNAFLKLLSPTENMKKAFKEIGVSSAEVGIATFGLQGFLEKLVSVSGDSATELGELFGRLRATQGALALTGENAEKFRKALQKIEDSAGATKKAAEEIAAAPAEKLRQIGQQIRTDFIELGRDATKTFVNIIDLVGGSRDAFALLEKGVVTLTVAMGALAAVSLAKKFTTLTGALDKTRLAVNAVSLASTIAIAILQKTGETVEEANDRISRGLAARAEEFSQQLTSFVNRQRDAIDKTSQLQLQQVAENARLRQQDANNAIRFSEEVTAQERFALDQQVKNARDRVGELERIFTEAQKRIQKSQEEVLDSQFNKEQFVFERRIKNLSEQAQIQQELNRATKIERDARAALAKGDADRARDLFDEAQKQRESALSSADQLKNQELIQRAETAIKRGFDSRINAEKQFQKDQTTQAEQAKALIPLAQQLLIQLETNSKVLSDQVQLIKDGKVAYESQQEALNANLGLLRKVNALAGQLGVGPALTDQKLAADVASQFTKLEQEQAKFGTEAGNAAAKELGVKIRTNAEEAELLQKIKARQKLASDLQAEELDAERIRLQAIEEIQKRAENVPGEQVIKGLAQRLGFDEKDSQQIEAAQQKEVEFLQSVSTSSAALSENKDKVLQALQDIGFSAADAQVTVNQLAGAAKKIDEVNLQKEVNFEKGKSFDEIIKEVNDLANRKITIPVDLIKANGVVQGQARGGRVLGFADGGFVPHGTDRIPAMLSKGEFVVNADSTRKFFSELVSINKGIRPKYMASGGPVTNVGDINISVRGGKTDRATLRNVAEGLRRELRRGSLRSF